MAALLLFGSLCMSGCGGCTSTPDPEEKPKTTANKDAKEKKKPDFDDPAFGHLRDVNETVAARHDVNEGAELHQLDHRARVNGIPTAGISD